MSDITPRKNFPLRIPGDLYDELRREAWDLRLSMNEVVTEALVLRLRSPKDKVAPWLARLGHVRAEAARP